VILIAVLICICLLGYLAQTVGLCMVRGVNEWRAGNREFLLAILLCGVLAWVAALFSHFADIPLKFRAYEFSGWFIFGGLVFGLGAALNQGCGVSTLSKLARGDSKMIATLVGWLTGWTLLASWQPQIEIIESPLPENLTYAVLILTSVALTIWAIRGDKERRKLWLGMMGIGLLAGFVFLFEPKWPPSGLLLHLSNATMDSEKVTWPSVHQYLLFIGLLSGMFLAAWRTSKFHFVPSKLKHWALHAFAGTLMGIGASLAMGGNDSQLLLALPTLSLAGLSAISGMLLGIWLGLYVMELRKG
jgi:hypothetical protein